MKIAIFGASGDQGAAQVLEAQKSGHQVIAIGRNPDRLAAQFGKEIEARAGDYASSEGLASAVEGADAVFVTLPSTSFQPAGQVMAAADAVRKAAEQAAVKMLVFNSSMIIKEEPRGFAAHDARHAIRTHFFTSSVPAIAIQPVIYQDNLLRGWARPAIAQGVVRYPHREDLDVCWITQEDTAKLMIAALKRPDLAGRAFNVGGKEAIRGPDLAHRLGAVLGRSLRFESQPISDFCAAMDAIFKSNTSLDSERLVGELGRIYSWYNDSPERPFFVDMAPILAELPVALTRFEDWAARQDWPAPATSEMA